MMMNLKNLLSEIGVRPSLSSDDEILNAVKLIIEVQGMNTAAQECIVDAYTNGPLFDGDVISKHDRDWLVEKGYISRVVVRGEEGYNACTTKGALANVLISSKYQNDLNNKEQCNGK